MNACTITDLAHLPHARVLARSYREHHPGADFTALVIGGSATDRSGEPFRVLTPEDLQIPDLELLAAVHPPDELRVALRPLLLRSLLDEGGPVVFLDPRTRVYAPLASVGEALDEDEIVLVAYDPRRFPDDGKRPSPGQVLAMGSYSRGFMALADGRSSKALLEAWPDRITEGRPGMSAVRIDIFQHWLDALPATVGRVRILSDPGLVVGFWNLPARPLSADNGTLRAAGEALKIFHFADFDPRRPHVVSEGQNRIRLSDHPALAQLYELHAAELLAAGHANTVDAESPYSRLPDGTKLDRRLRSLFREGLEAGELTLSPFTPEGMGAFYGWLNEPGKAGSSAGVTRYLYEIWRDRADLSTAYVHLDGPDGPGFVGWAHVFGVNEVPMPAALLPPEPAHLVTQREVAEAAERGRAFGVNVAGFFRSELGLGEAARLLTAGLEAAGVPSLPVQGTLVPPCRQEVDFTFANPAEAAYPISIVCMNGDTIPHFAREVGPGFFEGRHTIALWWWELGEFPDEWKAAFDHIDEVWVASQQIYDAVAPASPVPVVKVHLPVRMPEVRPLTREQLGLPEGFLFLYVYDYHSTSARKNPLGLVQAFKQAFPPGSGAKLALKCINAENLPEHHEEVMLAINGHPDITVIDRYVSAAEKNGLIASCDCYVSLHRSEGFGLTPAEAMYLGKPVIATRYGGTLEFMTPENSYLVDYEMTRVGERAHPYPADAKWADPDLDEAAMFMRRVFENRAEAHAIGERAARDIRSTHSPEAAGQMMERRLRWIWDRLVEQQDTTVARPSRRLDDLVTTVHRGPVPPLGGRLSGAKRAAWKPIRRLLRPYGEHQRQIDTELIARIEQLDAAERATRADTTAGAAAIHRSLEDLAERIKIVQSHLEEIAREDRAAREEHRVLPFMAPGSSFETFDEPAAGKVLGFRGSSGGGPSYRSFADAFRGPEDRVRDIQRAYVPLLKSHAPVLDLGCGRGEMLDLLAEAGIDAYGVDADAGMVEHCHAKGHHSAVLADGNAHLEGLADASLGAVVSCEVIEHMPHDALESFLRLSVRKLRPGGVLITETVNPHSVSAMKTFWVDPTHQHPLFPEVVLELCRIHGFASGFVFHPTGSGNVEDDRFREPIYAVVARTPG